MSVLTILGLMAIPFGIVAAILIIAVVVERAKIKNDSNMRNERFMRKWSNTTHLAPRMPRMPRPVPPPPSELWK